MRDQERREPEAGVGEEYGEQSSRGDEHEQIPENVDLPLGKLPASAGIDSATRLERTKWRAWDAGP